MQIEGTSTFSTMKRILIQYRIRLRIQSGELDIDLAISWNFSERALLFGVTYKATNGDRTQIA